MRGSGWGVEGEREGGVEGRSQRDRVGREGWRVGEWEREGTNEK